MTTDAHNRAIPLTDKVVRGLMVAMSAVEASPLEVLFALDSEDDATPEQRADLDAWQSASRWIRDQRDRRALCEGDAP